MNKGDRAILYSCLGLLIGIYIAGFIAYQKYQSLTAQPGSVLSTLTGFLKGSA